MEGGGRYEIFCTITEKRELETFFTRPRKHVGIFCCRVRNISSRNTENTPTGYAG